MTGLYTIPASVSFADNLAIGLLDETKDNRAALAHYLILLPTRRACRTLQEAFLRQTEGQPLLLPRMQPFGDIDAEELSIAGQGVQDINIPPALSALKRQILLAQTIAKLPNFTKGAEQDLALAQALGRLMDEIYTENLDLGDLPNIVDRDAFAAHWQITVDFLSILSEHWPNILESHGAIDAADRRNRLILTLNEHWQQRPPQHPIIAAGSTGSIPATAKLLHTISTLDQGRIILPALDQDMSEEAWNDIEEGHPQTTLKILIEDHLEKTRDDVLLWPSASNKTNQMREKIISHVMSPPEHTHQWQRLKLSTAQKQTALSDLKNIKRYDCKTTQEEADIIAVIFRETLETPDKVTALVTPDRNLARRVAMTCQRWNINIDDSAGKTLPHCEIGTYLRVSAQCVIENLHPVSFLAFLKHDFNQGAGHDNYRKNIRTLEHDLLRGAAPKDGFNGLRQLYEYKMDDPDIYKKPHEDLPEFIDHLHSQMQNFITLTSSGVHPFTDFLRAHLEMLESFSVDLWQGDEGEAAAIFLSDLSLEAAHIPPLNGTDYLAILSQFMKGISIRPKYGTHPRLMILGQLEARLLKADRVILGGLNEGAWPPDPGHDPWMSRPMRQKFGLPLPERSISLSAHDFVQGFCANEVFLTRAERSDGSPTVPARWLQRLDTFLEATHINPQILRDTKYQQYSTQLDHCASVTPWQRPAPIPDIAARPKRLSVTRIERWLKDPYAIYASEILKLRKLDPIDQDIDAATRGTILHKIMEVFTKKFPKDIPDSATDDFITIAREILQTHNSDAAAWSFWMPRMIRLAEWIVPHEQNWREHANFGKAEIKAEHQITDNFTLSVRADRIDTLHDGSAALIDYKSGGTYSAKKIQNNELPQLPLEALILNSGGFQSANIQPTQTGSISYWKLTGGIPEGEIIEVDDELALQDSTNLAREGLINLIKTFEDPITPYYALPRLDHAPAYNDYTYLERVKEWATLSDDQSEGA